jgi:hypothetical protein
LAALISQDADLRMKDGKFKPKKIPPRAQASIIQSRKMRKDSRNNRDLLILLDICFGPLIRPGEAD